MAMPNSPVPILRLPLQPVKTRKPVDVRLRAPPSRSMSQRGKRWSACYKNFAVIWVTRFPYTLDIMLMQFIISSLPDSFLGRRRCL